MGSGFANGSAAADKANAVAVEVWNTTTPVQTARLNLAA